MTEADQHRAEDRQHEPDGVCVLLHAAALGIMGAICRGLGAVFGRIQGWVAVHVCDAESRWVRRATAYNQRAYRVIRPWWVSADWFAHRRAEQLAQFRVERDDHDD